MLMKRMLFTLIILFVVVMVLGCGKKVDKSLLSDSKTVYAMATVSIEEGKPLTKEDIETIQDYCNKYVTDEEDYSLDEMMLIFKISDMSNHAIEYFDTTKQMSDGYRQEIKKYCQNISKELKNKYNLD